MGILYQLVNQTRRERISFAHLPTGKAKELAGYPTSAAITTWYLLKHSGDAIAFVGDDGMSWPFATGAVTDLQDYPDVMESVIGELIGVGIVRDDGLLWSDDDEPETCYIRKLTNIWLDAP